MKFWSTCAVALAVGTAATTAVAVSVPIANHDFSNPVVGDGQFTSPRSIPQWDTGGDGNGLTIGVIDPADAAVIDPAGTQYGYIALHNQNDFGEIAQNLSPLLLPNSLYTLTLTVANLGGAFPPLPTDPGKFTSAGPRGGVAHTTSLGVQLIDGGGAGSLDADYIGGTFPVPASGGTANWTFQWQTGATDPFMYSALGILLYSTDTDGVQHQALFTNIALDAPSLATPEPCALPLLLITMLGLRRRRH